MFEKPPPEGKRVTAVSGWLLGSEMLAPGGRNVAPTLVTQGQEAGKSGEKIWLEGPRQPFGESSLAGPETPESPEEITTEIPWRPSFMNSEHWRCWYGIGRSGSCPP